MPVVDGIELQRRLFRDEGVAVPRSEPAAAAELFEEVVDGADGAEQTVAVDVDVLPDAPDPPLADAGEGRVVAGSAPADDDPGAARLVGARDVRAGDLAQMFAQILERGAVDGIVVLDAVYGVLALPVFGDDELAVGENRRRAAQHGDDGEKPFH